MTYKEKLKDPRWQRKRLEILERDKWRCRACGERNQIMHVHHLSYSKSYSPWDCDNSELVTLCSECHYIYHNFYSRILNEKLKYVVAFFDEYFFNTEA